VTATDAGEVSENELVVSCAGTSKGLDNALVVKTAYSIILFQNLEVGETMAKPLCRVTKLPQCEFPGWKGNLDSYYASSA
jgi:hypothetical protein